MGIHRDHFWNDTIFFWGTISIMIEVQVIYRSILRVVRQLVMVSTLSHQPEDDAHIRRFFCFCPQECENKRLLQ